MSAGVSSDQRMKGQGNQGMFGPSYGQQSSSSSSQNYFPNGNGDTNTWGAPQLVNAVQQYEQGSSNNKGHQHQQQQSSQNRRNGPPYDDHHYNQRDNNTYGSNDGVKRVEQSLGRISLDGGSSRNESQQGGRGSYQQKAATKPDPPKETVPKQMTWASIASQPAKPQVRTSSSSSILKKKGPGMPPPPMVPGKHNLDIGTWDSPKNGPALVPPPPLPIVIQPPINTDEVSPLSNAHPLNNPPKQQQQQHHHQNHHHNSLNRNAPSPPMHGDRRSNDAGPMGPGGPGDFRTAMHRSTNNDNNGAYNNRNNGGPPSRPAWSGNTNNRGGPPMAGSQESRGGGMLPSFQRSNINARGASPPPPNNYRDAQQQHVNNQHSAAPVPLARGPSIPNAERSTQPIQVAQSQQQHSGYNQSGGGGGSTIAHSPPGPVAHNRSNKPIADFGGSNASLDNPAPVAVGLDELRVKNQYNPQDFDFDTCVGARFFVIKSYSEDDIHRSIKYEIWCSTDHGNRRLDQAFHEREKVNGVIYLLFSVNGSGHFCGVAQMLTAVDYNTVSSVWSQSKWKGSFKVKWIYVKDVPNTHMRHIRLENNENKPVTNSRDAQEVPNVQGIEVLRIISAFKHVTSIFDDFVHYEKRQQEEVDTKKMDPYGGGKYGGGSDGGSYDRGGSYGGGYERNKGYGGQQGGYSNRGGGGGGGYNSGGNSGGYDNRRGGDDYNNRGGGNGGGYERSYRDNDAPSNSSGNGFNREGGGGGGGIFNRNQPQSRMDFRDRRDDGGNRGFMSRDRDNNDDRDGGDRGADRGSSRGVRSGGGGGDYQRGGGDSYNDKY